MINHIIAAKMKFLKVAILTNIASYEVDRAIRYFRFFQIKDYRPFSSLNEGGSHVSPGKAGPAGDDVTHHAMPSA
jgi:hypothetical protein